ncbi:MAG: hypothetical protein U0892_00020 [Pirellulales bacterium]
MLKFACSTVLALAILSLSATQPLSAAGGGGGGGGGGSVKPMTVRLTGYVTAIQPAIGGVQVTLGTSYYSTGTFLVTADTKIIINGSSSGATVADLRLGDFAQADVNWVSRMATKLEAVGLR